MRSRPEQYDGLVMQDNDRLNRCYLSRTNALYISNGYGRIVDM